MPFFTATALMPLLMLAPQPGDPAGAPWRGKMQCTVTWKDSGGIDDAWTLAVASDTNNMALAIAARATARDPKPLAKDETRELEPRKAKLDIAGMGGREVEVTSFAIGQDRMWHDVPLGHVENLDKFPAVVVVTLTFENAAPMEVEMRDFVGARAYLKRCLDR
jgi:hypothetical protein